MTGGKLVQLRVPEELLRRIDGFVHEGLYRSRSEFIVDATRRFLERSDPSSPLELFIDSFLNGAPKPSKEADTSLDRLFEKLRKDARWRRRSGNTPEEVMRKVRSRAA
jgi:Arc/MetJ-type ribon-helix-helix transcriptional regulator